MAKSGKNYYDFLGVLPSASMVEIKRAYRAQARRHHPDFNPDDAGATQRFQEIQAAYDCLKDAASRTKYDHSIGFKSSHWTESVDERDDPGPSADPASGRASSSDSGGRTASSSHGATADDEPLGPRSEAARAAAEEMRRRIHKAEREGFGIWGSSRAKSSSTASERDTNGTPGNQAAADPGDGGTNDSSRSASGTGRSKPPQEDAPGTDSAGAARPRDAAPETSTQGSSGAGGSTASGDATANPRPEPSTKSAAASSKRARRKQSTSASPRRRRLLGLLQSPSAILTLFILSTLMAIIDLIIDPERAAFFGVLAVGLMLHWRLTKIEAQLKASRDE